MGQRQRCRAEFVSGKSAKKFSSSCQHPGNAGRCIPSSGIPPHGPNAHSWSVRLNLELQSSESSPNLITATEPTRRKRGPSLSRRVGQTGNVFQHCKPWNPAQPAYGRFWIDMPEGRKRRTVTLGMCRTKTLARCKLRDFIEREGINTNVNFAATTTPGSKFASKQPSGLTMLRNAKESRSNQQQFLDGSTRLTDGFCPTSAKWRFPKSRMEC